MEDYLKIKFTEDGLVAKSFLARVICETLLAIKTPDATRVKEYAYYAAIETLARAAVIHATDGYLYIREPATVKESNLDLYEGGFISNYIELSAKLQDIEPSTLFEKNGSARRYILQSRSCSTQRIYGGCSEYSILEAS